MSFSLVYREVPTMVSLSWDYTQRNSPRSLNLSALHRGINKGRTSSILEGISAEYSEEIKIESKQIIMHKAIQLLRNMTVLFLFLTLYHLLSHPSPFHPRLYQLLLLLLLVVLIKTEFHRSSVVAGWILDFQKFPTSNLQDDNKMAFLLEIFLGEFMETPTYYLCVTEHSMTDMHAHERKCNNNDKQQHQQV